MACCGDKATRLWRWASSNLVNLDLVTATPRLSKSANDPYCEVLS